MLKELACSSVRRHYCSSFLHKIIFTVLLDWSQLYTLTPSTEIAPNDLRGDVKLDILEPVLFLLFAFYHRLVLAAYLRQVDRFFVRLLHQRYVDVLGVWEASKVLFLRYCKVYAHQRPDLFKQEVNNRLSFNGTPFLNVLGLELSEVDFD